MEIKQVIKRSGAIERFDRGKIYNAIYLCFTAMGKDIKTDYIRAITRDVVSILEDEMPHVETIQNAVKQTLVLFGEFDAARQYIYRDERAKTINDYKS